MNDITSHFVQQVVRLSPSSGSGSDNNNNTVVRMSSDSMQSLVAALDDAQLQSARAADRLQESYDVLERMSAELSDSRSVTLQIQAELTQSREQHAAAVERLRLEFDLERETWMDRAEAQFMKRVKRMASRVASQEQELLELRAAIGSLRAMAATPGGSELALRLVEDAILASSPNQQQHSNNQHHVDAESSNSHSNLNYNHRLFAQQLLATQRTGSASHQPARSGSRLSNTDSAAAAAGAMGAAPDSRGVSGGGGHHHMNIHISHHHAPVSPPRLAPAYSAGLRGGMSASSTLGLGGTKRLFETGVLDAESATVRRLIEKGYLSPP